MRIKVRMKFKLTDLRTMVRSETLREMNKKPVGRSSYGTECYDSGNFAGKTIGHQQKMDPNALHITATSVSLILSLAEVRQEWLGLAVSECSKSAQALPLTKQLRAGTTQY